MLIHEIRASFVSSVLLVGHVLKNTDDLKYSSPLQIVQRVLDLTSRDFNLLCCLIVRHLGSLYQKDPSLASGVSMLLFPYVRPWNVKRALFGDSCSSFLSIPPPSSHSPSSSSVAHRCDPKRLLHEIPFQTDIYASVCF